ncbi:MAG: FGGY family carbohydrate kinase, partial [Chloroflexota bacterium]
MTAERAAAMNTLIGLDLGTSALKAVALDDAGTLLAQAGVAYLTGTPRSGWAEQQPADWRAAAFSALETLHEALNANALPTGLALSAQLPTLVLMDEQGAALRPAIVWSDGRAGAEAAWLLDRIGAAEWYGRTGIVLDAHYLAPMHAWVACTQAPLFASPRVAIPRLRSGGSTGPTEVGGTSRQTKPTEKVLAR